MPVLPNLNAEVFYGDPEKPLPNWREHLTPETDDDKPLSEDERKALIGVLGFDPAELYREEPESDSATATDVP